MSSKFKVEQFLDRSGVRPNIFSAKPSFYKEFNNLFTLGWGNSYIKEKFCLDDEDLIHMFTQVFRAFSSYVQGNDYAGFKTLNFHRLYKLINATQIINWQRIRAKYFSDIHYELPHQLYVAMLGESRAYSSGYWSEGINTLSEAQDAKFNLIVRKLGLNAGDTVLDFGCGAGSLGRYAGALGIKVVGLNICKEQLDYARKHNDQEVPAIYLDLNLVTQSVAELRDRLKPYGITEFDAVTFVGSIEHVGWKNYEDLFKKLNTLLKPEGKILCHTIGSYQPLPVADPYIMTKIFPDSQLAVGSKITRAAEETGFKLTDWHNMELGLHSYAKTLRCWLYNFRQNWSSIKPYMPHKDKEAFYREWVFYLMLCIGGFEADNFINVGHYLWQKINNPNPGTLVR
jgi:cyclopropane fatty-acyl-phospholipid synthase-like methyltransferase